MTIKWEEIKGFDTLVVKKKVDSTLSVEQPLPAPENAIYFEALGPGILYSINYERMVTEAVSIRIGYSSWQVTTPFLITSSVSFTGIPIMVNVLQGDGNSKLELGAGIEFVSVQFDHKFFGIRPNDEHWKRKSGDFFRSHIVISQKEAAYISGLESIQ